MGIDRTEFLKMCQKCALLPKRIGGVINNIPLDLVVVYQGTKYYPCKYELSFDNKGNAQHTAILHDLYSNSITHANLERVERYEQTRSNCDDKKK